MNNYTMWIVLGVLVFLFFAYIIIVTILDKKKTKKAKIKKEDDQKKQILYGYVIIGTILKILQKVSIKLKFFIPGISKETMADIKNFANNQLIKIEKHEKFKETIENKKNHELKDLFHKLKKTNANLWQKKYSNEIDNVKKALKSHLKELDKNQKQEINNKIKEIINKQ